MWAPHTALAAGLHQDFSRSTYFLIAPSQYAVEGRASLADAPSGDAAVYTATATMPFRLFLFQLEFPYVAAAENDTLSNGAGDPVFRMRFTAWSGGAKSVYVLFTARMGSLPIVSSQQALFPYATGSLDLGVGLAYADTVASVAWWLSGMAITPTRVEEPLGDSGLYDDYATSSAGVRFPVSRFFDLQGGVAFVFPKGQSTRPVYFGDLDWNATTATTFYGYVQFEGAAQEDRAVDYSVGLGTRIRF